MANSGDIVNEASLEKEKVNSSDEYEITCRACLNKAGMINLFCFVYEDNILGDIYKTLSLLQFHEGDGLPNKLCNPCADFVIQFYTFRKKAIESDYILKNIYVKEEDHNTGNLRVSNSVAGNIEVEIKENVDFKQEDESYDSTGIKDIEEDNNTDSASEIDEKPKRKRRIKKVIKRLPNKQNSNLTCSFCDMKFDTYTEYTIHRKKEADKRRKKYPCSVCHKLISTYKLKDHVNSHTKERPYQCITCGEKFRFRSSLTRHNFIHNEKKPHECHICGKGFIQAPTLTDHLRTHTGEKSFICNVCGKSFITKHALGNHINMHRIRDGNINSGVDFTCKICHKVFSSKSVLKNHKYIHSEKEFLCSECGKKFATKTLLDSHLKVHSGVKPYVCEVCNKGFSQKNSLQKHTLTHTGEKPVLCIVCGKRFSQKGHLTYHMRRHSGERPYSCPYCEKTFNHTGSLKVHIRIHTGEKPFLCDICSKGFYDSSSMKKHRKIHDDVKTELNLKMEVN